MVDLKVFAGRGGLGGHPPFRIERQPGGKLAAGKSGRKKCSLLARFRGEMGNLLLLDSRSAGWRESRSWVAARGRVVLLQMQLATH